MSKKKDGIGKKILNSFIDFLRNEYKFIIFTIILVIVATFPLPYYIFVSGGITDLNDRFIIEDGYEQEGSYNLSYVNRVDATVLTYLISNFVKDWEVEEVQSYKYSTESIKELEIREQLMLLSANQNAVIQAYTKANKPIDINKRYLYVAIVNSIVKSDKTIQVGDIIKKIDDIDVEDYTKLTSYINTKNDGDYVELTFDRNDEEYTTNARVNEVVFENNERRKLIGIEFIELLDFDVNPDIKFTFSNSESGSSAGLMTTLAIYDTLIEEDLTHGLKIAGTGTISKSGLVGEIGGVNYKLKGAVMGDADIFFVPTGENYEEAIKIKEEKGYDIEIVEVETFDDAVDYLKKYNKNN
jgi:PDZ domain-containing protein